MSINPVLNNLSLDDKKHGEGVFSWGNGKKYEGKWVNGKQHVSLINMYD